MKPLVNFDSGGKIARIHMYENCDECLPILTDNILSYNIMNSQLTPPECQL